ncbi:hypothetical protein [Nocardia miyunensis]|uniref:hypothetical protein n=1 Tax=Nocardia miyunensis TaxID=282684 RepID=UPI000A78B658|nr:hypothetical protein [Nocardia miyunensis]
MTVYLDDGDPLHFRAGRAAAEAFAAAAEARQLARVVIDEQISPNLPVMPYEELWR